CGPTPHAGYRQRSPSQEDRRIVGRDWRCGCGAMTRLAALEATMTADLRWLLIIGLLTSTSLTAAPAHAQSYPTGAVRVTTDGAAGSTPDVVLGLFTDRLTQLWGQRVLVANQPGASGSLAARAAADSSPDGNSLYAPVLSTFAALPGVASNLPIEL